MHLLQVAKNLAAQVEHDLLAGPLHQVGLRIFEDEADCQRGHIDKSNLSNANDRIGTQPGIEQAVRPVRGISKIFVNRDFGEVRAKDVYRGLENNGSQRNHHLPFIGAEISQQPLHQTAVIRFT